MSEIQVYNLMMSVIKETVNVLHYNTGINTATVSRYGKVWELVDLK